ncbi:MAG: hypothetical protein ACLU37_04935 [Collinsella sp.]
MTAFYTGVQALFTIASFCLTIFVAWRDTEHMNQEDERQEMAEISAAIFNCCMA